MVLKKLVLISGLIMVFSIFLQVFSRYVFKYGFSWTEEIARIAMIWTVFLAMPLGFDIQAHIGLEVVLNKVSPRIRHFLVKASILSSILVLTIISWGAVIFMFRVRQRTPGMNLPFQWIYLAIPFGSLNAIFRLFLSLNNNSNTNNKVERGM